MIVRYFNFYWDRPLGSGGEGVVVLARSVASGQLCAAKFANNLIPHIAQIQVRQELHRVLRVSGDNVVRPVAWNLGYRPFIVYEFAQLGSLRDEMNALRRRNQVYHPWNALFRIWKLLLGVRDTHHSGMVHRDVKPENFLVFANDVIKLHDFGLGRSLARPYAFQTQRFVGTPIYASPEQVFGGAVDWRSDLYSIGVILYEMLTGHRPGYDTLPIPPSQYHGNIVPSLDSFCLRLLSWHKHKRPYTVDVAMNEVRSIVLDYKRYREFYRYLGTRNPF